MPGHAALIGPCQDGVAGQFGAVVTDHHPGPAALGQERDFWMRRQGHRNRRQRQQTPAETERTPSARTQRIAAGCLFSSVEHASVVAETFSTIFMIPDQQTLDCSILRALLGAGGSSPLGCSRRVYRHSPATPSSAQSETPAHASHRQHLGACVSVADHGRRIVGKDAGHRRQVADVAVDHPKERDDRGLVGGDAV